MNRDLVIFSKRIRAVFQIDREKIDLPFFSGFPTNSCRGASIFLGYLLNEHFPDSMIQLIHGSNRYKNEHHYWLEVDGYVFDITADQFDQFSSPIYASLANPLQGYFSVVERSCVVTSYVGYDLEETLKSDTLRNISVLLNLCKIPF